MNSGLVYIGKVNAIFPIPDADRIESLEVVCGTGGKWRGSAIKGQFQVGDLCEVYLQDSLVPQTERFAFMERRGWRVRMERLRGMPSECLIMPCETLGNIGTDITEAAGVTKYEKVMPANIGGDILGAFPSYIPKTDEPNFQRVPYLVAALIGRPYYVTVKADGSSGTIFWHNNGDGTGSIHGCSRNYELKDLPGTAVWQLIRRYKLDERLAIFPDLVLQFEIVGPGIQGNPLGLKQVDLRLFNVYNKGQHEYASFEEMLATARYLELPTVEIVEAGAAFPAMTDDDLRKYAERTYPNGRKAEGIVIRSTETDRVEGERLSFKVINLLYKEA